MRKDSTVHYATAVTQYERITNGQAWANPEYALAAYGNTGCSIANVYHVEETTISQLNPYAYPFGQYTPTTYDGIPINDYKWQANPEGGMPQIKFDIHDHKRQPHSLRFSGFTIDDVGITDSCIVTNLYVHVEYTDNTIQHNFQTLQLNKVNGSNWLITVYKANKSRIGRKRFDGISTTSPYVSIERIPMMRDQSWATNTWGYDLAGNFQFQKQKSGVREQAWYVDRDDDEIRNYRQEYFEDNSKIPPIQTPVTIADINDPGFFIDIWYGKFYNISGVIKIKSVGISVEYIKPFNTLSTLYPIASGSHRPKSIVKPDRASIAWVNADKAMSLDTTDLQADNFATINLYNRYLGNNYTRPFGDFDSDFILGRLPALSNIDDTTDSISDIILNFRVWDYHFPISFFYQYLIYNRYLMYAAGLKWSYVLYDGYPLGKEGTPDYGTPIWKNCLQLFEPGMKRDFNLSGQDWIDVAGGWNDTDRDFYGREFRYYNSTTWKDYYWWYTRHYPIRRYDSNYTNEIMNTAYYPGMVYDPLWIEKGFKAGNIFIGLSVAARFKTSFPYYNYFLNHFTNLQWPLRVKGFGARVRYNRIIETPPTGPSGPISVNRGLLIRHTP